jgi:hypothetical protein
MTVETAALAQQHIEELTPAAVPALRSGTTRRQQTAFIAMLGVVEATWVVLLVELVRLVM